MSKTSNKSRYQQLMEWIPTVKKITTIKNKSAKFSKANHYKNKGVR